jgi:hypothetical protein
VEFTLVPAAAPAVPASSRAFAKLSLAGGTSTLTATAVLVVPPPLLETTTA